MNDKYRPHDWAPHERPTLPGSPSTPLHATPKRWAFAIVGVIVALTGGLGNALVVANLDALADCLSDLPATALLWEGWSAFARAEPVPFHSALEVLAAHARDDDTAKFVVLLRGEGPDLPEVASLD